MTVGELIEQLQEFPEESYVLIDISEAVDDKVKQVFDISGVEEGNNKITVYIVAE